MSVTTVNDELSGDQYIADRFRVDRRIGSGGMGVVYRVYDRRREQVAAIKTLRQFEPAAIYRLKQEFRVMAGLAHPNLVTLGELFHDRGQWFFTMEFVEGQSFIDYVLGDRGQR